MKNNSQQQQTRKKKIIADDEESYDDGEYAEEEMSEEEEASTTMMMENDDSQSQEFSSSATLDSNNNNNNNTIQIANIGEDDRSSSSGDNDEDNAYVMGIDEAGRGPVIGPLVYASMFCKAKYNTDNFLRKTFKVNDSKKLTAKTRNTIFDLLRQNAKIVHYMTCIIHSDEISHKMLSRKKYNLNLISHDCAIHLIKTANEALNKKGKYLKEVYIDTVGDPTKYQTKLQEKFPEIEKIVVDKKADSKYPVVGGASIVAKVKRDEIIDSIQSKKYPKLKMGSGYTSDKYTKEFLKKTLDPVFGYDHHDVRFSWATIKKLLNDTAVSVEWEDDGDEDEMGENAFESPFSTNRTQTKLSFHIGAAEMQRHRIDFMSNRKIELVSDL
ncbi:hypothetical protein FDP41_010302 [Naegleria fowleri]|uniref:Ribonuclease n=1 Tax=Naegleria fowleri TaxID=5763 RepID=A0A6A5C1B5_NAEFO|nr:uncharacterized protein FDP41_010302 [Naegleria fowleri]KAF0983237.1 hypothetical protein FDP41_010302 [Naegleria fowleri]